jgi:cellulose synthase/poly-beta-1,6-N-acetylglucosamine synthase-like glycosyltransferase
MFAGVKAATGDIIVLSDAGSYHDGNTVQNLVRHFQDERIVQLLAKM